MITQQPEVGYRPLNTIYINYVKNRVFSSIKLMGIDSHMDGIFFTSQREYGVKRLFSMIA